MTRAASTLEAARRVERIVKTNAADEEVFAPLYSQLHNTLDSLRSRDDVPVEQLFVLLRDARTFRRCFSNHGYAHRLYGEVYDYVTPLIDEALTEALPSNDSQEN